MKKKPLLILLFLAETACASASGKLGEVLSNYLCAIFKAVKNIVGPVAVLILVVAGLKWLWAQDEPGDRKQAKTLMENVLIGLTVILAAGGIVYAIIKKDPCGLVP